MTSRGVVYAATAAILCSAGRANATEEVSRHDPIPQERFDVGLRMGYTRPVGAFDDTTHAADTSHGGIPLALDFTVRLGPAARWNVALGLFGSWAETIPRLCASASDCFASLGRDAELGALARVRAPRVGVVLPEAEIGAGFSWSIRSLTDGDATSSRNWSGPVLVRAAVLPTLTLGSHTRLALVVGGSVARSTSFHLVAPGVEERGITGATLHGTLDLGMRFGVSFGE